MKNKLNIPSTNISEGVAFFLKGAQKRRLMAMASIREINAELCVNLRLVATK